jgi:hypothetical protein
MASIPNITQTVYFNGPVPTNDNWANTGLTFEPGQGYTVSSDKYALLMATGYFTTGAPAVAVNPVYGNTLCILGDSFDVRSGYNIVASISTQNYNTGIWALTNMIMDNAFIFLGIDGQSGTGAINPGTGADTKPYSQRIQALLDKKPKWISIRVSVNDFANGYPIQSIIGAYSQLFDMATAAGCKVITNTCGPMTTGLLSSNTVREIRLAFNRWLTINAPNLWGAIVLEQSTQYLDPDALTGQCVGNTDLHPPQQYAYKIAKQAAAQLEPYIKYPYPGMLLDSFGDGSLGLTLDVNPINTGTAGTKGANITADAPNGYDGNVATSYGMTTTGGLGTVNTGKTARTSGPGYWQSFKWTPTVAGQLLILSPSVNVALGTTKPGDWVQAFMEFEIDSTSDAAALECPRVWFRFNGTTGPLEAVSWNANSQIGFGEVPVTGVIATLPIPVPTGSTSITINYTFVGKTTGTIIGRIGRHGIVNLSKAGFVF